MQGIYPESFKLEEGSFDTDVKASVIINGKLVGIESQGDPNSRQGESMEDFVERNCDFIVIASRMRGETYRNVSEYAKGKEYKIIWCTNDCYESRDEETIRVLNERYSVKVLQLIKERIG